MSTPAKFDEVGDSADLQALFDSIAVGSQPPPPPPPVAVANSASGDSDELQALFDSVLSESSAPVAAPAAAAEGGEHEMFNKVGTLARQLHDSLRGLGYDHALEAAASQIPDAQQRLAYVAQLTEQAANRVLAATEAARPLQDALLRDSEGLATRWDRMFANELSIDEFKLLASDTRAFFGAAPGKVRTTNDQLTEIMMAQDFQDLTGQVIKKIVDLVQDLERQLVNVLIETMPEDLKAAVPEGLMNGPVVSAKGRTDVVTSQSQVDDLLESLGF
ncbi:MAG TPA: protein phosphatase CheZ [Rhodocyclaceae bacterium]|nr:protein phosphatase CheZ [Rhodocyclaceae bacterium]